MAAKYSLRHRELVDDILRSEKKSPEITRQFIEAFYAKLPVELLEQFAPARAREIAQYARRHFETRPKGDVPSIFLAHETLTIDGQEVERLRVIVINHDRPFLVDSLLGLFNHLGLRLHVMFHPLIATTRDAKGKLTALHGKSARQESLIYAELSPLPPEISEAQLQADILRVMQKVYASVADWKAMDRELESYAQTLRSHSGNISAETRQEILDFVDWLRSKNFVFLGAADYPRKGDSLLRDTSRALGIYRLAAPDESVEFSLTPTVSTEVIITKATHFSEVHRNVQLDFIALPYFNAQGKLAGEFRLLGLFTSNVYYQSAGSIPFLRRKIAHVLSRAGFEPVSYDGKALKTILEFLPRDEVFQIDSEHLFSLAMGVLSNESHPQVKLFLREDPFRRFVSAMVYIPRERFSTAIRDHVNTLLATTHRGTVSTFYTQLTDSPLARLHVMITLSPQSPRDVFVPALESKISALVNVWEDALRDALIAAHGARLGEALTQRYAAAFPNTYVYGHTALSAVYDIQKFEHCAQQGGLALELFTRNDEAEHEIHLKCFSADTKATLSSILPLLENMGLTVRDVTPYVISPKGSEPMLLRDFALSLKPGCRVSLAQDKARLEEALNAVWQNRTANDALNGLVFLTPLTVRDTEILRAYVRYLLQAGSAYRIGYVMQVLCTHHTVAHLLVQLFHARFAPTTPHRDAEVARLKTAIEAACNSISNLAEDRILRRILAVLMATLRTNFYQRDTRGAPKPYLSLKLHSADIPELPLPVPFAEIFVTSQRVEGIHLRGDRVARGGLRWSDRPEDFRTEVLGLLKAQMVKNAVIVPSGAKGGFVLRQAPSERSALQQEGVACYKLFLRGLLDITDNIVNGKIVPPREVVRHDGDDPYLVVAADKGTASFSDIANSIAAEYGFWLGDAFASGGSVGYDHKAMAITARGAWVSVERHFREAAMDITKPFTAVGIGDMSGDVFGNGLLLSNQFKLLAAFNHRHIFLDPTPDVAKSFAERQRLFALAGSGWNDYNPALISKGGGVYERSVKSIALSKEVRAALGTHVTSASPDELIQMILKAPVDLLWNGGIGTYVKASSESHDEVGDRNNNALRVNGNELRCKMVGEGGNLGFTQRGRIEYARAGGRINTDAIDNSAGVDCSDHEVNIKIALGAAKNLPKAKRDALLKRMTDEVARLVLRDNELQTHAISLAEAHGSKLLEPAQQLMQNLERDGLLNRSVEFLPSDKQIGELRTQKLGLSRPEIAVLLAYSKMEIYSALKDSAHLDAPYFIADLLRYFPKAMQKDYAKVIAAHPLKREIIATMTTNSMVNRTGITLMHGLIRETGLHAAHIAQAYVITRDAFDLRSLWSSIEGLSGKVEASVQADLFAEATQFIEQSCRWLLTHMPQPMQIDAVMAAFKKPIAELSAAVPQLMTHTLKQSYEATRNRFTSKGVPAAIAERVALLEVLIAAWDIVEIAQLRSLPVKAVGSMYFELGAQLRLGWLRQRARAIATETSWQSLAIKSLITELYQAQQNITLHVLGRSKTLPKRPQELAEAWVKNNADAMARYLQSMTELEQQKSLDYAMLIVVLRQVQWIVNQ